MSVEAFCQQHGFQDEVDLFYRGALAAQRPKQFEDIKQLSEEDKAALRYERDRECSQSFPYRRPLTELDRPVRTEPHHVVHDLLLFSRRHDSGLVSLSLTTEPATSHSTYAGTIPEVILQRSFRRRKSSTHIGSLANGANLSFPEEFGIAQNGWLVGFVNSASVPNPVLLVAHV